MIKTTKRPAIKIFLILCLAFAFADQGLAGEKASEFTNSIGMTFVRIQPGVFTMGSPDDEPGRVFIERRRQVTLTKGFYMQTTEITQGQWKKGMGANPSHFKDCGDDCPVEQVSWDDVQSFILKLNKMEGGDKYRLPTEAEWEYACRAGSETPFSTGYCLSTDQANYNGHYPMPYCTKGMYVKMTTPAANFQPNAWGLYDMHGNVWEWCQDWAGSDTRDSVTDPKGKETGQTRIIRGGSWYNYDKSCRSASRESHIPEARNFNLGARLVKSE